MTTDLTLLALGVVLGIVQIVVASHAASWQRGYRWTAGPRDAVMPPLVGVAGRLERALQNFGETFPLFAAAVVMAHVTGRHGGLTLVGAHMYFWARVAYVLCYAAGVPLIRSLIWSVATVGIALILVSLWGSS
jgi:uncharacterized MAPEG superfamily protein